jgi:hypothetical protein
MHSIKDIFVTVTTTSQGLVANEKGAYATGCALPSLVEKKYNATLSTHF